MTARQVTINLTQDDLIQIAAELGTWKEMWIAIGHLSTWNLNYPYVNIYRDGGADLVASYRDVEGDRQYTIGAVWHGDHYGFHS